MKIATLNAGMAKVLWKYTIPQAERRFENIIIQLEHVDIEVLCFQEVFQKRHFEILKKRLPQYQFAARAMANNILYPPGLCVFSKYPIQESTFTRFSDNENIEKITNHGFQLVKLQVEPNTVMNIFNTHLSAGGIMESFSVKQKSKIPYKQFDQILSAAHNLPKTLIVGDLNCGPTFDSDTFNYILSTNFFNDVGYLNHTWNNTNPLVKGQTYLRLPDGQIDHILRHKTSTIKIATSSLCFSQQISQIEIPVSDHYGICCEVIFS